MSIFESAPSPSGLSRTFFMDGFYKNEFKVKSNLRSSFWRFLSQTYHKCAFAAVQPLFSNKRSLWHYSCYLLRSLRFFPSCCICKTKLIPQRLIHLGSKCCPNICSFKKDNTQEKLMYMDGLEIGFLVDCQFTHVGILVEC